MKIRALHLHAFGPFSNVSLDLSAEGRLHLVYGPNEAGKSTALRAIGDLLYGIPQQTGDAHRHAMPDLRIGADLAGPDASLLSVLRRKGRKNTLLTPAGDALDETALLRLLGGIERTLFESMFGLDHVRLREGAEALLADGGNVGESLFDASVGGRGSHAVLEALRAEANELFKPRASTARINVALKEYKEAQARAREAEKRPEAWHVQKRALEAAETQKSALEVRRRELLAEQQRLERAAAALPLLNQRSELAHERAALGEVPALPPSAREERIEAERQVASAARELTRLSGEIERLQQRRAQHSTPALAIDPETVEDLQTRLGSHNKAAKDLPGRRGELKRLEEDARSLLRRLGREADLERAAELLLPTAARHRLKSLALERGGLVKALEAARERHADVKYALGDTDSALGALGPLPDPEALRGTLRQATGSARLGERVAELTRQLESTDQRIAHRLAALPGYDGEAAGLPAISVPALESVERFDTELAQLERRAARAAEQEDEAREQLADLERQLDALAREGEVPSEAQLDAARQRRDQGWGLIRRAWQDGEQVDAEAYDPEHSLPDAFEQAQARADELADRLRREADRVARQAELGAQRAERKRRLEAGRAAQVDIEAERKQAEAAWRGAWQAAGIVPQSPAEMRGWLRQHAELVGLVEQRADLEREQRARLAELEGHRAALARCLEGLGSPVDEALGFDQVVEVASVRLAELDEQARRLAELSRSQKQQRADLAKLEAQLGERKSELERWSEAWVRGVQPLGLGAEALPEEVHAVLDELDALGQKLEAIAAMRRRVEGIVADAAELERDVAKLVQAHAPDLAAEPTEAAGRTLVERWEAGRADHRERSRIDAELEDKREEHARAESDRRQAEAHLAELMARAGVDRADRIEAVEQRVARARELDAKLASIDDRLTELRGDLGFTELLAETRDLTVDQVRIRSSEVEDELGHVNEELQGAIKDVGTIEGGMKSLFDGSASAAEAAALVESHAAQLTGYTERYLRARLAVELLEREIERYREENQGPVLARSAELFPELTLGRYTGVRVELGSADEPVLRCVRADGRSVGVEGLSDGTRDQLYLALRIASLERHAAHTPPLPVVLDDILVHFDDERALAALRVLAVLAQSMQVLFFTHHTHLCELAREAAGPAGLAEHELTRASVEGAVAAAAH